MDDRIARASRAVTHDVGVVSTSSHAVSGHGRSVVTHHCNIRNYSRYYIAISSRRCDVDRGPTFSLCWDIVLSSAVNGGGSVACTPCPEVGTRGGYSARGGGAVGFCHLCARAHA